MKEIDGFYSNFAVKQDFWADSPCSACNTAPCCRNLPITSVRIGRQIDFINLLLVSSYEGILPALKTSGEWIIYLQRKCSFLGPSNGKCSIHGKISQSLICKAYDAHNCWYREAFNTECFSELIPFDTGMLVWFEKRFRLAENRFQSFPAWRDVSDAVRNYKKDSCGIGVNSEYSCESSLTFSESASPNYLFFPPYRKPSYDTHLELLSFRLSFPGIFLGLTDTFWAFVLKTGLDGSCLDMIRREYFPAIGHNDGAYSFREVAKDYHLYSSAGDRWIILGRSELETLKELTSFDNSGGIRKLPSCSALLDELRVKQINRDTEGSNTGRNR